MRRLTFIIASLAALNLFAARSAVKPSLNSNTSSQVALPDCEGVSQHSHIKYELKDGLKSIPKGLLVAREAYFFVESVNDDGSVKIKSHQSFLNSKGKPKAKILCGSSDSPLKNRFSMMAPTLIHNKIDRHTPNIYWQFQVLADQAVLSSWNTRSIALQSHQDVEKIVEQLGYQAKVYQLGSNKFEIQYQQKTDNKVQSVTVVYDLD